MSLDTHWIVFRVFVRRAHQSKLPSCRKFTFFSVLTLSPRIVGSPARGRGGRPRNRLFLTLVAILASLTSISSKCVVSFWRWRSAAHRIVLTSSLPLVFKMDLDWSL